jgi:hypothetical protein
LSRRRADGRRPQVVANVPGTPALAKPCPQGQRQRRHKASGNLIVEQKFFFVKLLYFNHIGRSAQLTILHDYRGYLQIMNEYLQGGERYVINHPNIPEKERPAILRTIHFRMSGPQSELRWVDAEIARLQAQQEETP